MSFEGGEFESDRIIFAKMLKDIFSEGFLSDHALNRLYYIDQR